MKLTMKLRMPVHVSKLESQAVCARRTLALVAGKDLPSGHDHIVKDLQADVCLALVQRSMLLSRSWTHVHLVCGYCASERILSTRSQASGFSLNWMLR